MINLSLIHIDAKKVPFFKPLKKIYIDIIYRYIFYYLCNNCITILQEQLSAIKYTIYLLIQTDEPP